MINLADDSNATLHESSTVASRGLPQGNMTSNMTSKVTEAFTSIALDRIVRNICELSLCAPYHDAMADMQYDLPGSFIRSCYLI